MSFAASITARLEEKSDSIERARAEFNFVSIENHITPGSRVLDVGAWRCHLGQLLRDHKACRVLNVDVVDANQTDMPLRVFDGEHLPVESESQDVVLLLYVLHHAKDDEPLLREAHRVLRKGGRVIVAEDSVNGLWNWMLTIGFHIYLRLVTGMTRDGLFRTTPEWERRFQSFGFKVTNSADLGHHLGRWLWPRNLLFVLEK